MTKKHFIALADAIKANNEWTSGEEKFHSHQLKVLADFCAEQNPNFNRERWLDYIYGKCDKNGGKVKQAA